MNNYLLGAFTIGVLLHELSPSASYIALIGCYGYNLDIFTAKRAFQIASKYYELKARVGAEIAHINANMPERKISPTTPPMSVEPTIKFE